MSWMRWYRLGYSRRPASERRYSTVQLRREGLEMNHKKLRTKLDRESTSYGAQTRRPQAGRWARWAPPGEIRGELCSEPALVAGLRLRFGRDPRSALPQLCASDDCSREGLSETDESALSLVTIWASVNNSCFLEALLGHGPKSAGMRALRAHPFGLNTSTNQR